MGQARSAMELNSRVNPFSAKRVATSPGYPQVEGASPIEKELHPSLLELAITQSRRLQKVVLTPESVR